MKIGMISAGSTLLLFLAVFVVAVGLLAIYQFIEIGKKKGHAMENVGLLWLMGIALSPFIVGLYVAALPDKRGSSSASVKDELPSL